MSDYRLFNLKGDSLSKRSFKPIENENKLLEMERAVQLYGGNNARTDFRKIMKEKMIKWGDHRIDQQEMHDVLKEVMEKDNNFSAKEAWKVAGNAGMNPGHYKEFKDVDHHENEFGKKETGENKTISHTINYESSPESVPVTPSESEQEHKKNVWDVLDKKKLMGK